jgi:hypothetical protein
VSPNRLFFVSWLSLAFASQVLRWRSFALAVFKRSPPTKQ